MDIDQKRLTEAMDRERLDPQQADALRTLLTERERDKPGLRPTHILYYSGGLLAIGAMSLFMNLGWQSLGGQGLMMIALGYAGIGLLLTEYLLRRHALAIPAGITATIVVVLTPLAIYGFQMEYQWLWWSEADELAFRDYHYLIDWRWQLMELATLLSGTLLLWRYRLPFLTMPIAVTLWYMSMDLAPYLFGPEYDSWLRRSAVSAGSGLLIIGLALTVDIRGRRGHKDYAFWFHLISAPGLRGVWRAGHHDLPDLPGLPGLPFQPGVSVRADADRSGDRRAGHPLPAPCARTPHAAEHPAASSAARAHRNAHPLSHWPRSPALGKTIPDATRAPHGALQVSC
ncbi:MAG: hypothetical protein JNL99_11815 [Zoogloea sp.]|nr:hypothetical protein [Zoogloea sp.]